MENIMNGKIDETHNLCKCSRVKWYTAKQCKVCYGKHKRGKLSYGKR